MKSLMWLLGSILTDVSIRCNTDTQRDYQTIAARVEDEGLSFLTITLPTFCTGFERGLREGYVDSSFFPGFKGKKGSLPALLWGLTSLVFDWRSGRLLEIPDVEAIRCIRQVCLMWKKVNINCSLERTEDALVKYVECDEEVGHGTDYLATANSNLWSRDRRLDAVASVVLGDLEFRYLNRWRTNRILPKHGPGATAERISGNRKYTLRAWHNRLEASFPFDSFALPNANWLTDDVLTKVNFLEPDAEMPVRVITVPKTLKTPRVIAIEPVCMQYAQQALSEMLMQELQHHNWYTKGKVNFTDQTVNQMLALSSSKDGKFATLDLEEASDRVSVPLVNLIFRSCPSLLGALMDCRSRTAQLPDGTTRPIKKFASMGSATCFPVESMVFYTIVVAAIAESLNLPASPRGLTKASRDVYVYGDDIIVPVDQVETVIEWLSYFGLKVNRRKSFWTGKFRESCGMDAYDGVRVTPVYLRELPDRRRSSTGLVSLVSFANQLYKNGWWHTARDVRAYVEGLVGPLPHVQETSSGLGWNSYMNSYSVERWNDKHQVFEVKTYAVRPILLEDPIQDHGALMKFFLSRAKPEDREVLSKSVRPGGVYVNRRWVRPY